MKRIAILAGLAMLALTTGQAKQHGHMTYFVEGRDITVNGQPAFTVDAAVIVTADPANRKDWNRKLEVARARLSERITLTPEAALKYAPACADPDSLLRQPIVEEPGDCGYGDPDCPNFKTYFSGPPAYCMGAATNCKRVIRGGF